jgi:apolipoprotein N-acyltransferase
MKTQNYSNHSRLVAGWHGVTFLAILAFWIGSFVNLAHAEGAGFYSASLLNLAGFIFLFLFVFVRMFALKAQDRAIRAEENLRHFALTGKLLPASLGIGQIVALRFAADEEFVSLAAKAAAENLTGKEIKQSIHNWKADTYRV